MLVLLGRIAGTLGLQAMEIAVVRVGDRILGRDGEHAIELALRHGEASGADVLVGVFAHDAAHA